MQWRRSIAVRLAVLFALTSTSIHLAVSVFTRVQVEAHFRAIDVAALAGKVEMIRHAAAGVRVPAEIAELPRALGSAFVGHQGLAIAVVDPQGNTLLTTPEFAVPQGLPTAPPDRADPPLAEWRQGDRRFRGYATTIAVGAPDHAPLRVVVALDTRDHGNFMRVFDGILWLSAAGGIALTGLLGWLVARRGIAPLHDITAIARTISANRLRERIEPSIVPSELQALARSFNDMLDRLDGSFRRLTEYAADLAHELRTPIGSLTTQAQVALTKPRSEEEYREILYANLEEYERLSRTIADMLYVARADNKLLNPESGSVALGEELDDLVDFYQAYAEERNVSLVRSGDAIVSGDRLMLRRLFSNLLSNALRHARPGSAVNVSVAPPRHRRSEIVVENSGDTIPAEHLPRLFDRFYRVDASRARQGEGAGLGLAIAKAIAVSHGGAISAMSADDVTRITVILPCPEADTNGRGPYPAAAPRPRG